MLAIRHVPADMWHATHIVLHCTNTLMPFLMTRVTCYIRHPSEQCNTPRGSYCMLRIMLPVHILSHDTCRVSQRIRRTATLLRQLSCSWCLFCFWLFSVFAVLYSRNNPSTTSNVLRKSAPPLESRLNGHTHAHTTAHYPRTPPHTTLALHRTPSHTLS